jgi:hypothetical protein
MVLGLGQNTFVVVLVKQYPVENGGWVYSINACMEEQQSLKKSLNVITSIWYTYSFPTYQKVVRKKTLDFSIFGHLKN